jgi:putative tricarboxylic transport membrane protein
VAFWEDALRKVADSEQWKREYLDRFRDEPRFVGSKEFGEVLANTDKLYRQLMTELDLIK